MKSGEPLGQKGAQQVGSQATDGRRERTRSTSRGAFSVTVLFLAAFAGVLALRATGESRKLREAAVAREIQSATLAAARVDAVLARADGALQGARALLDAGQVDSGAAVAAAARAGGFPVTLVSGGGFAAAGAVSPALAGAIRAARPADGARIVLERPDGLGRSFAVVRRLRTGAWLAAVIEPSALSLLDQAGQTGAAARTVALFDARGELLTRSDWPLPREAGAGAGISEDASGALVLFASAPIAVDGARIVVATSGQALARGENLIMWFYLLLFSGAALATLGLMGLLLSQGARARLTETALCDTEERFRITVEGAGCGVWDWSLDTDEVYVTTDLARMMGGAAGGRLSGPDFLSLVVQMDRAAVRAGLQKAAGEGEADFIFRVQVGGRIVWLQARGRRLDEAAPGAGAGLGPVSGMGLPGLAMSGASHGQSKAASQNKVRIVGVALDITDQREAQARLMAAERRLLDAINSFTGPFALWDSRKRLVMCNRSFAVGFELDARTNRQGASYDAVALAIANLARSERADPNDPQVREVELLNGRFLQIVERATADGGLVTVGIDITPIKRQQTDLLRKERELRVLVSDLERSRTEQAELAKKYEAEKLRAEEASLAKSAFLANMSHELRTPLNAINGFSEIMRDELFGPLGNEQYKQYAADIHTSGAHLLSLINDVLHMAKIEAGKSSLTVERIDPVEALEEACRIMHRRADDKQIHLEVHCDQITDIDADPRAVKQILLNLLSNAVKFTPEGGRVTARLYANSAFAVFEVIDTGIGISPEDLPRLARPFEQVASSHARSHSGSGLGLALTKSLAEMHGGRFEIESELGKGTTVRALLPLPVLGARPGEAGADGAGAMAAAE
jgi:two-component system cell cycle sensor histidine kinase PleC